MVEVGGAKMIGSRLLFLVLVVYCFLSFSVHGHRSSPPSVGGHHRRSHGGSIGGRHGALRRRGHRYSHSGSTGAYGGAGARADGGPAVGGPAVGGSGGGKVFNVLEFGAAANGVKDDTRAFLSAWAAACRVAGSTVLVPAKHEFLLGPISFSGPNCQPNINFQVDGTIRAPTDRKAWLGFELLQWIQFTKLRGITIAGQGTIDGSGSVWWGKPKTQDPVDDYISTVEISETRPTALRFYGSYDVSVSGITIQNSPQCHLKFDSCTGVTVTNISISSPATSPNTDGIHLQNSKDVLLHHSKLASGDDCVSIQTGSSNINIRNLDCGPGHGISIGGLGKDNSRACVSNVTVRDVNMYGTMTGVRIKTWQGGSGWVQGVTFSNIVVSQVQFPIVIDQYYCDRAACKNQSSAVALAGITYQWIRGSYTVKPVHLACSDRVPCTGVILNNIQLHPQEEARRSGQPFCWRSFGISEGPLEPPVPCLQEGNPLKGHIQSSMDMC
ncbi:unnamed protein product [Victoria cruziana]